MQEHLEWKGATKKEGPGHYVLAYGAPVGNEYQFQLPAGGASPTLSLASPSARLAGPQYGLATSVL